MMGLESHAPQQNRIQWQQTHTAQAQGTAGRLQAVPGCHNHNK